MVHHPPDRVYITAISTNPDLAIVFLLVGGAGVGMSLKNHP